VSIYISNALNRNESVAVANSSLLKEAQVMALEVKYSQDKNNTSLVNYGLTVDAYDPSGYSIPLTLMSFY